MEADGIRMEIRKDGQGFGWEIGGMTWQDWQRMLLGLTHAAGMLSQVVEMCNDSGKEVGLSFAVEDLAAILQAREILQNAGKAIERTPELGRGWKKHELVN